jgi:hypothetical protein
MTDLVDVIRPPRLALRGATFFLTGHYLLHYTRRHDRAMAASAAILALAQRGICRCSVLSLPVFYRP